LPLVALAALGLVAVLVAGSGGPNRPPLDPDSTAGDGTKALVDTLRELGAEVDVGEAISGRAATALLLIDELDEDRRERLVAWVRSGGTLVVADPVSPLTPEVLGPSTLGGFGWSIPRACDLPALRGVERVSALSGAVYETPPGAVGCFPRNGGHWLVVERRGAGAVVALGGRDPLLNGLLRRDDNAALAVALLAPRGGSRVVVLRPPQPGAGEATLGALIPARVKFALAQLAVAFVVVVLWRARRLGRPVSEPQPVVVPGSELVVAVGNLLQQTRARQRAADILRDGLGRSLAQRLGLPSTAPPEQVAAAAAARGRLPRERLVAQLTGPAPGSEAALLELARELEQTRLTVLAAEQGDARVR
jgi:hypothetical protein